MEGGDQDGCKGRSNFTLSAVTDTNCTLQCSSGYTREDSVTSTLECPITGGNTSGGMVGQGFHQRVQLNEFKDQTDLDTPSLIPPATRFSRTHAK